MAGPASVERFAPPPPPAAARSASVFGRGRSLERFDGFLEQARTRASQLRRPPDSPQPPGESTAARGLRELRERRDQSEPTGPADEAPRDDAASPAEDSSESTATKPRDDAAESAEAPVADAALAANVAVLSAALAADAGAATDSEPAANKQTIIETAGTAAQADAAGQPTEAVARTPFEQALDQRRLALPTEAANQSGDEIAAVTRLEPILPADADAAGAPALPAADSTEVELPDGLAASAAVSAEPDSADQAASATKPDSDRSRAEPRGPAPREPGLNPAAERFAARHGSDADAARDAAAAATAPRPDGRTRDSTSARTTGGVQDQTAAIQNDKSARGESRSAIDPAARPGIGGDAPRDAAARASTFELLRSAGAAWSVERDAVAPRDASQLKSATDAVRTDGSAAAAGAIATQGGDSAAAAVPTIGVSPASNSVAARTAGSTIGADLSLAAAARIDDPTPVSLDRLSNVVRSHVSDRRWHVNLQLDPPDLGRVTLDVTARDGGLNLRVQVASEDVRRLVESRLSDLGDALRQHDLNVARVEVAVRPGAENGQSALHERRDPQSPQQNGSESGREGGRQANEGGRHAEHGHRQAAERGFDHSGGSQGSPWGGDGRDRGWTHGDAPLRSEPLRPAASATPGVAGERAWSGIGARLDLVV